MLKKILLCFTINFTLCNAITSHVKNESNYANIKLHYSYTNSENNLVTGSLNLDDNNNLPQVNEIKLLFTINDLTIEYKLKKYNNYSFKIKDNGIYLTNHWHDHLVDEPYVLFIEQKLIYGFTK